MSNMKMEEFIKTKTQEIVDEIKDRLEKEGQEFTDPEEHLFRMGISYGITIASIALNKLPVDIAYLEPEKEVNKEDDNLLTFDDYVKSHEINISAIDELIKQWSEPKCKCPCCGIGALRKNISKVLTTYPVKYEYQCDRCAHIEYLDF